VQTLGYRATNESASRHQSFEGTLRLSLVSLHIHENPRRACVFSYYDTADARQSNARIAELTLDDGLDLLAKGLSQALPMIFLPAPFHQHTSE
jgi:hypothetical protein